MRTITYSTAADRFLRALSEDRRQWVENKVERYASLGEGDVKALKGSPFLRLRCGPYRVIFSESLEVLAVFDIGNRGDVYR